MGKRIFNTVPLLKKEAKPGDIDNLRVPKLSENQVIVPDTMCLTFKFNNSNTKSWFLNNLGKQLINQLSITMDSMSIYDNTGESVMETCKDLWKSDKKREEMIQYGVANENIRKYGRVMTLQQTRQKMFF